MSVLITGVTTVSASFNSSQDQELDEDIETAESEDKPVSLGMVGSM